MEISHEKCHRWANLYSRTLVCCTRLYFSQILLKALLRGLIFTGVNRRVGLTESNFRFMKDFLYGLYDADFTA